MTNSMSQVSTPLHTTLLGPFKIDNVGEISLKLKNVTDNEIIILKVKVSEIGSTLLVEFQDEDFKPPYRIENMTKHDFIVAQNNSRGEDNDIIHSYQIMDYALSYPLNEKVIKLAIRSQTGQNHICDVKLDSFKNSEKIIVIDKKNKVSYVISITRENAMKIIRIQEEYEFQIERENQEDDLYQRGVTLELKIPKFGISLINSSTAEEIVYVYFKDIQMCIENTKSYQKFKLDILAIQIDDQLAKAEECMVLKKNGGRGQPLLKLNYCLINNQGFEHIIHFKELNLELHPIELFLNGSFCAEIFKYSQIVQSYLNTLISQDSNSVNKNLETMVPEIVKEKQKQFDQSIYFENLYVDQMKIKFSFNSNPDFLNQTHMNSTVKFFIAMLMNMKHVELHFKPYIMNSDPVTVPMFIAQLQNHYLYECYSHKQLIRILSSVGLLGNLHDTINNFKIAFMSLVANPSRNGNFVLGVTQNVYNFARYILYAVSNTLTEVADSLFRGMNAIIKHNQVSTEFESQGDHSMEIEKEFLDNINSLIGVLDTQNKIWLSSFATDQVHDTEMQEKHEEENKCKE